MKKIKFEYAINEYLKECELNMKFNSYRTIKNKIDTNILPYFIGKNIYKLTKNDYKNWKIIIENKNYSISYKKNIHNIFVIFLNFCLKEYDLKENIASISGNFKQKKIEEKNNIWSEEEFKQFCSVIKNKHDLIMFKLLFYTGIRKGELLALKYNDIDFINNYISINKNINRLHDLETTKTISSNRTIYVPESIIKDIENNFENNNKLLFNISFTTLKRKKDYYCNLSNVKQIKIHEFRHSHACYLYLNGIPINEISSRLGHSNISITTDIYLRYLPKKDNQTKNLLSSVI